MLPIKRTVVYLVRSGNRPGRLALEFRQPGRRVWNLEPGTWNLESGTWNLESLRFEQVLNCYPQIFQITQIQRIGH